MGPSTVLDVQGVSCGYGKRIVLEHVTFSLAAGRSLVLLGPNGVGKTTLFKTVLGFLPRLGGRVLIDGEDAAGWSRKRYAKTVAYVPQSSETTFAFTVEELVLMGRTPALDGFAVPGREDERIAYEVIEQMGLESLAGRPCTELSGGELQMVLVARALAQRPRLLVMDEPCANLDLGNQAVVLGRIRALADEGLSVLVTSHDPSHAFLLGGDAVCVGRGSSIMNGPARETLTASALTRLYGVDVGVGVVRSECGKEGLACTPFLNADAPLTTRDCRKEERGIW